MTRRWLIFGLAIALQLGGCAARQPAPPRPWVLEGQGIQRLGFVPFHDPVSGTPPMQLSQSFWDETGRRLQERAGPLVARPGPRLAASWLRQQGTSLRVDAFAEGVISGQRVQPRQQRVWLSLTVRVLEARTGRIVWSRRLAETAPLAPGIPPAAAFDRAVRAVAREFAHALSPDPSPDPGR